jgi:hypothetical protein
VTQLYRHFDGNGVLLYVGVTRKLGWRLLAHQRNAGWWRDVRTVTITSPYRTRKEALEAEAEAINVERPKFNQQHNPAPVTPPIAPANTGKALARRLASARRQAEAAGEVGIEVQIRDALAGLGRLIEAHRSQDDAAREGPGRVLAGAAHYPSAQAQQAHRQGPSEDVGTGNGVEG